MLWQVGIVEGIEMVKALLACGDIGCAFADCFCIWHATYINQADRPGGP